MPMMNLKKDLALGFFFNEKQTVLSHVTLQCCQSSFSKWSHHRSQLALKFHTVLGRLKKEIQIKYWAVYYKCSDMLWKAPLLTLTFKKVILFENPQGEKVFFVFVFVFFHQNQPNLRSLPIAVSYLSVFFFLINSQSLGSLLITSWCLTCDKTLRLVFKLSNYIVSGAIYCRYWLTVKGTGMKRKKEIELESWHRDFLFLLCRACIAMF